jgi:hypothetical protein
MALNVYTVYLWDTERCYEALESGEITLAQVESFVVDADSLEEARENAQVVMEIDESYDGYHIYKVI